MLQMIHRKMKKLNYSHFYRKFHWTDFIKKFNFDLLILKVSINCIVIGYFFKVDLKVIWSFY